jgi:general secretion pathway protein G
MDEITRTGDCRTTGSGHTSPRPILPGGDTPAVRFAKQHPLARHRGFTIVELMLIVALIGILAAVALPFYRGYKERIRIAQAVDEIHVMSAVASNFWNDNHAYPSSLADIGQAGKLDPWGNPYVYYNIDANGKGQARKDHALNPLNTDFDLYSNGADGVSKSQITQKDSLDDVIRASNGAYVGLASGF